jgi:hypothetical protein
VEEMRAEKTEKFAELKDKKGKPEYEEWFLRYRPLDPVETKTTKTKTNKTKTNKTKTNKTKKKRKVKKKGLFF